MNDSTALVVGSLAQIARQTGASLAETFIGCDAVILVDVSGSMHSQDAPGGRTRYAAALAELRALQEHLPGKLAVIAFSTAPQFTPSGVPAMLGGNTDLARALKFARVADTGDIRFVVISDGEPDQPERALAEARQYHGRIDTVYVGPEERPLGRDFLAQLAQAHGGQSATAACTLQLAQHVERLLLAA
jgi:Mg-chelatase subunit ChlD